MADQRLMTEFHFRVTWDGLEMSCRKVSGLGVEAPSAGDRMPPPGVRADAAFREMIDQNETGAVKRLPATVSLIDESGTPDMVWTLANARPVRITGIGLKPDSDETTIESIELSRQGKTRGGRWALGARLGR